MLHLKEALIDHSILKIGFFLDLIMVGGHLLHFERVFAFRLMVSFVDSFVDWKVVEEHVLHSEEAFFSHLMMLKQSQT